MKIVDWLEATWNAGIAAARRHSRYFDHFWRARERYSEVLGGRLAAAIAYYGFFAVFALALLAYSVVGFVLASNRSAVDTVNRFLQANLPFVNADQIAASRTAVAVIGIVGLVFTGVGWIEALRSSQRAIWQLEQQPGNVFIRRGVDLAILVALGLLLALSVWVQGAVDAQIRPLLLRLAPESVSVGMQQAILTVASVIGIILALLVNCVLAASILSGVSRLRMPFRRLLPSTLLVAIGLSALSTIGRVYINYSSHRPAFQLVGGTVGLLLFLYLFNQLLLFGAALAATSSHGEITDLAAGPPPPDEAANPPPPDEKDQKQDTGGT